MRLRSSFDAAEDRLRHSIPEDAEDRIEEAVRLDLESTVDLEPSIYDRPVGFNALLAISHFGLDEAAAADLHRALASDLARFSSSCQGR